MRELTTEEVADKLQSKEEIHIIDVREDEEVTQGMIPGAMHIPLGTVPESLDKLDKNKEYIMVCRSGGRSGKAQAFLHKKGYQVINMAGGMLEWEGPVR